MQFSLLSVSGHQLYEPGTAARLACGTAKLLICLSRMIPYALPEVVA